MEREKSREELLAELETLQQALRESEARLQRLTDNMSEMVVQTDLKGIYTYVSPSHASILGYEPAEMLGKSVGDYIHPDDLDVVIASVITAFVTSSNAKVEYRMRHADGHYVWLESVISPLLDDNGMITGSITIARDISARKQAEEALRAREEDLRHMASVLMAIFQALPDLYLRLQRRWHVPVCAGRPTVRSAHKAGEVARQADP